jgi:hypothetical protein
MPRERKLGFGRPVPEFWAKVGVEFFRGMCRQSGEIFAGGPQKRLPHLPSVGLFLKTGVVARLFWLRRNFGGAAPLGFFCPRQA